MFQAFGNLNPIHGHSPCARSLHVIVNLWFFQQLNPTNRKIGSNNSNLSLKFDVSFCDFLKETEDWCLLLFHKFKRFAFTTSHACMTNNRLLAFAQKTKRHCNSLFPASFRTLMPCGRFFWVVARNAVFRVFCLLCNIDFWICFWGLVFCDEQTLLSCFCNDGRIQHFSRHSFPCCSHTRHSMNVSNNNSQLPTIKPWRMATLKQRKTSPFSQVQSKGFAGEGPGGVLFFFVTLRASRDETAASPQGLDSSHGDKGSLLGVSRLTASSKFYTPPLIYHL